MFTYLWGPMQLHLILAKRPRSNVGSYSAKQKLFPAFLQVLILWVKIHIISTKSERWAHLVITTLNSLYTALIPNLKD